MPVDCTFDPLQVLLFECAVHRGCTHWAECDISESHRGREAELSVRRSAADAAVAGAPARAVPARASAVRLGDVRGAETARRRPLGSVCARVPPAVCECALPAACALGCGPGARARGRLRATAQHQMVAPAGRLPQTAAAGTPSAHCDLELPCRYWNYEY